MRILVIAVAPCMLAVWACADSDTSASAERTPVSLEHHRSLTWELQDTAVLNPRDLVVRDRAIYVLDAAEPDIRILDLTGQPVRVIGSRGGGPLEFASLRGLATTPEGDIVVTDDGAQRVSIITPAGELVGDFLVNAPILGDVIVDQRGRIHIDHQGAFTGQPTGGQPTIGVYSQAGERMSAYGEYQPVAHLLGSAYQNQSRFARGSDGTLWTLLPYQGRVVLRDSLGQTLREVTVPRPVGRRTTGPFVDTVSEDPLTVAVVRSPVADDFASDEQGRVYVLTVQHPEGGEVHSRVHIYSASGDALGWQRLNGRVYAIDVDRRTLYAIRRAGPHRLPQLDIYTIHEAAEST